MTSKSADPGGSRLTWLGPGPNAAAAGVKLHRSLDTVKMTLGQSVCKLPVGVRKLQLFCKVDASRTLRHSLKNGWAGTVKRNGSG